MEISPGLNRCFLYVFYMLKEHIILHNTDFCTQDDVQIRFQRTEQVTSELVRRLGLEKELEVFISFIILFEFVFIEW